LVKKGGTTGYILSSLVVGNEGFFILYIDFDT